MEPKKNQTNYEKHGLSFDDAELVFENKTISFKDDRENYRQIRCVSLNKLNLT